MKIAIVDDESELRAALRNTIESLGKNHEVQEFAGGEALLLCPTIFDVCFLDIGLKGQSGMETAREMRQRGLGSAIVFVTSHADYVYEAFDVDAAHYLLKPVQQPRLAGVLEKVARKSGKTESETLIVKQGQDYRKVPFAQILLLESVGHKMRLHLAGDERIEYYGKIEETAEKLDARFFRCHRAYIVNLQHVAEKSGGFALLQNGLRAPVARKRVNAFTAALLRQITEGGI